jgi:hypothetical protein
LDDVIHEVKNVSTIKNFHLLLEFENDEFRVMDCRPYLKDEGLMAELCEPEYFRQVKVDPDLRTIVWPNGMDFCPDVLYEESIPINMPKSING